MSTTRTKKSDARQRIVKTAEALFYAEGVRGVGIDRIIAEAEVAKMTLYNHFPSKDDLILAVVQYRETKFDALFEKWMARHGKTGMPPLEAFFAALKQWFKTADFRGCMFINTCAELADAEHPASRFAAEHKQRFSALIERLTTEEFNAELARSVAPAIALLVEGAIVSAVMQQTTAPAEIARDAALSLIQQQTKH